MKYKKITGLALICMLAVSIGTLSVKAETDSSTTTKKILPTIRKDVRNPKLEEQLEKRNLAASSTEKMRGIASSTALRIKEMRASTTMMFKQLKNEKRTIVKQMKVDVFQIRKDALIKELGVSLGNITRSRDALSTKITAAEATGKNMSDAKIALAVADDRISKAKTAVTLFSNTIFVTSSSTTATSSELNLDKPRKLGDDTIKSVKDARDAVKKLVQVVAGALGLKVETATTTSSN